MASVPFPEDLDARPRGGCSRGADTCQNRAVANLSLRPWLLLATSEPAPPALLEAFTKEGLGVAAVDSREGFEAALADRMVVVALVDLAFPGVPLQAFRAILAARAPQVPLVLIADGGSIAAAIEAVKGGARDYVMKPLVVEDVLFVVQGARTAAAAAPAQAPW